VPRDTGGLSRPSCVLLDMDNTLYAYAPAHAAGMAAAAAAARELLNIEERAFVSTFDDARAEIKRRLGRTAASHYRLLYFQRTIERLGLASQVAAAMKLEHAYWTAFLDNARLFPEVHEFLDDLRLAGVPAVVVTDLTSEIQFRKFLLWRLDRYIDWIVTSEEAGADKPEPRIFELALAKLGGVEGPIWMVGDDVADIAGAKAAVGAVTFQLVQGGGKPAAEADVVIRSFGELRAHLNAVVGRPSPGLASRQFRAP
jgi:putative hydrolase of the HAD superfamily